MNLFDKAKNTQPTKKVSTKDSKLRVKPDNVEQDELFEMLEEMATLTKRMKTTKAKLDMVSSEVKELSTEAFIKLYEESGKNPGTFMVEAENENTDIAQVMFVPTDRYIKINEERAVELKEKYGDDMVEETTTYGFDAKILNKYADEVSEAIMALDIPESAKSKLIKASTDYSVKKGSIDDMFRLSLGDTDADLKEVFEDIKPVVQLKGAEVIEG